MSNADVCNRKVCTNAPATHYNTSTREYYCTPCARKINEAAGQDLCYIESTEIGQAVTVHFDNLPEEIVLKYEYEDKSQASQNE